GPCSAWLEPIRTPSPTEIANPISFAADAANLANRLRQHCGTGISPDGDTTRPRRDVAGLWASLPTLPPHTAATMAENLRLSWDGGEIRRETDCLLEGSGFHDAVMRIGGEAPGGGANLLVGIRASSNHGFPPPRIVNSAVRRKASASAE